jgi:amidase
MGIRSCDGPPWTLVIRLAAAAFVAVSLAVSAADKPKRAPAAATGRRAPGPPSMSSGHPSPTLRAAMSSGKITSRELVLLSLSARIKAIDKAGPKINSVIEVNPDALAIAEALDKERKQSGARGPLHGIPVLIKDNIATADRMQTTAGSIALAGVKPPHDSFVAQKLREAGAVILGKTNLSEWANIRSIRSTSGWSSRGWLTRNPYALDRNTSGSSSGSGAAMAANLSAVAVGTETDGSITAPSVTGSVGIKPTVGLVSRSGIIPIAHRRIPRARWRARLPTRRRSSRQSRARTCATRRRATHRPRPPTTRRA